MPRGWLARLLLILLACLVSARPVHAGTCSNPTGNEADRIYNGAYQASLDDLSKMAR
jgi:hypothetical protein